jgi:GNAT superfamily N-acetyltransferase
MDMAVVMSGSVRMRPLQPDDRERLRRLFYRLSPLSVYRRFASPLRWPRDDCLDRLMDVDHVDREAIAALEGDEIVAVARYFRQPCADSAEVAVVVADDWQRRGLGILLLSRLGRLAHRRGIRAFTGTALGENRPVFEMIRRLGRRSTLRWAAGQVEFEIPLATRD